MWWCSDVVGKYRYIYINEGNIPEAQTTRLYASFGLFFGQLVVSGWC